MIGTSADQGDRQTRSAPSCAVLLTSNAIPKQASIDRARPVKIRTTEKRLNDDPAVTDLQERIGHSGFRLGYSNSKLHYNGLTAVAEREATKSGNILGSGRAELDGEMLDAAFIDTSDFKTILEAHDATFVVGRRGTGKSALFIKAKAHFESNARMVVLAEKPEEHESIELQRVLGLYAPDYRLARALCRIAWKIDILLSVVRYESPILRRLEQLPEVLQQFLKDHSHIWFADGPLRCAEIIKLLASEAGGLDASLPNRIASAFHLRELQDSVRSLQRPVIADRN